MRRRWLGLGLVLLAACGSLEQRPPTIRPTPAFFVPPTRTPEPLPRIKSALPAIPTDDPRSQGQPDAPITIIEYSDFECPFCQRHAAEVYPELLGYVERGQVRYVFRNYIASSEHRAAPAAAIASLCAAQQDAFWPMHDRLFADQATWSAAPATAPGLFAAYAAELELDSTAFAACQNDPALAEQVQAEINQAIALGGTGTPTFAINTILLPGAQSLAVFAYAIEQARNEE